mgnify:CR=1 FL=1
MDPPAIQVPASAKHLQMAAMPVEQITQVWPPLNEFRDMYDNSTPSDFGNPADTTQHPDPVTTSESAAAGPGSEAKHDPDSTAAK